MTGMEEKGAKNMRIEKGINTGMLLGLLAMVILTIAIFPQEGRALTGADICNTVGSNTTTDTDKDGIPDYYECYGFNLQGGQHVCGYLEWTNCTNNCCATGSINVDPSKPDLFVDLIVPTTGSLIYNAGIPNLLQFISDQVSQTPLTAGTPLGIATHIFSGPTVTSSSNQVYNSSATLDRQLTTTSSFTQKAVRMGEDYTHTDGTTVNCATPTTTSVVIGQTTAGPGVTPNLQGLSSKVWSNRLATFVTNVCACSPSLCYDNTSQLGFNSSSNNAMCTGKGAPLACCTGSKTGTCLQPLINLYQKQNVNHEIGHMLQLTPDNSALTYHYTSSGTYTGYNQATSSGGAGSIMEKSVYLKAILNAMCTGAGAPYACCTGSGAGTCVNSVTFYIPQVFDGNDPNNLHLK
jgi:hypothetical protein